MERIALDVHAHLVPVEPERLARFRGVQLDAGSGMLTIDGHRIGVQALYRPAELVAWMDRNGVERAFVSAPPPTYRDQLRGDEAEAWATCLTGGLVAIAERFPDRLAALAHLPAGDPAAAAAAANAALERGLRRFSLPAGGIDAPALSDEAFAPLWRALDGARAFVFVHPGECADGRLSAFYLSNLLGNPYETAVAISHLVFGGVAERHPGIRFCFAHGGGVAPMLGGRWQRGFATARPGLDTALRDPSATLKGFCVDCITHGEDALALAEATFGPENILFGSDWPFPMGLPEPHAQLAGADAARRRRIFCDNPAALGPA